MGEILMMAFLVIMCCGAVLTRKLCLMGQKTKEKALLGGLTVRDNIQAKYYDIKFKKGW